MKWWLIYHSKKITITYSCYEYYDATGGKLHTLQKTFVTVIRKQRQLCSWISYIRCHHSALFVCLFVCLSCSTVPYVDLTTSLSFTPTHRVNWPWVISYQVFVQCKLRNLERDNCWNVYAYFLRVRFIVKCEQETRHPHQTKSTTVGI